MTTHPPATAPPLRPMEHVGLRGVGQTGVDWADLVIDLRSPTDRAVVDPLPAVLPAPGVLHQNPLWRAGRVEIDFPDTRSLPSGGPGGLFAFSVHLHAPARSVQKCWEVVTVATYPDGFRLGCISRVVPTPVTDTPTSGFRSWASSGLDGMSHAFTNVATGWSIAQRAWMTRRWYEHAAAAPAGVLASGDPQTLHHALTHGFGSVEGLGRITTWRRAHELWHLQAAGFWFPDPEQAAWLTTGSPPLASLAPGVASESALWSLYESGWMVEAYRQWRVQNPEVGNAVAAHAFIEATRGWTATVQRAFTVLDDRDPGGTAVARAGEVASLCIVLGFSEFDVGLMVGERTFSIEALRTLAALRAR